MTEEAVNTLIGANDEEFWRKAGLFTSTKVHSTTIVPLHSMLSLPYSPFAPSLTNQSVSVAKLMHVSMNAPGAWTPRLSVEALQVGRKVKSGKTRVSCEQSFPAIKPLSRRKHRTKLWLPNHTKRKMVLGSDLGLEEVVSLSLNALVG